VALAVLLAPISSKAAPASGVRAKPSEIPQLHIDVQRSTLPNGLRIVLAVDHTSPTVAVDVMYDVGARNEERGHSGFAHLFEHLMFQGSANVPKGEHMKLISSHGGTLNANTSSDRTNYFDLVPASELPLALWLEADRMKGLDVSQANLDNQRLVVEEEYRLRVLNAAYAPAGLRLEELVFQGYWPYEHPVIGSMADLDAAKLDWVRAFHAEYYAPNEAVLVISGDFDPTIALDRVTAYFAGAKAATTAPKYEPGMMPEQAAPSDDVVVDAHARFPAVLYGWPIPAAHTPDHYALEVAAAVLADGESSRLYKTLVHDKAIAIDVDAETEGHRGPDAFEMTSKVSGKGTVADVEKVIVDAIAREDIAHRRGDDQGAQWPGSALFARSRVELRARRRARDLRDLLGRREPPERRARSVPRRDQRGRFARGREIPRAEPSLARGGKTRARRPGGRAKRREEAVTHRVIGNPGRRLSFAFRAGFALGACSCGRPLSPASAPAAPAPSPVAITAPSAPGREQPPPPLEARPSPFPAVAKNTLPNGLRVSVVESHALPVIELRVVVHAGTGFGAPGVSEVTARMLKEGGTRAHASSDVVRRIEMLGSSLGVAVGPDATRLTMSIVRGQLDQALEILGEVLTTPRFDPTELTRVKARMTDQAQDNARSNGTWSALRILFGALFPAGSPYASYGLVPAQIAKVDGTAIRDFYERLYVPSNVEFIVAGDVDTEGVGKAVDKALGHWKAPAARPARPLTPVDFPQPRAPDVTRVIVASRPKSVQSDVIVSELLPERHSPSWPTDRVALQVFGGGLTGRLFQDVREKRSLAYSANAHPIELAHDAQPLFAYAGTQAPKTADAVQAVLDTLGGMRTSPPTADEVTSARRYLSDIFAVRMETLGAIADMVAQLRELDLPDDYWDSYRAALRTVTAADADAEAIRLFTPEQALILVAGDADIVAEPLTRFGDVTVVDPEHDFRVIRSLPKSH